MDRYPRVEIDLAKIKSNAQYVVSHCEDCGIEVAGVVKGCTAIPAVAKQFAEGGCKWIASSRLEQLEALGESELDIDRPLMLIRGAMLSEVPDVVRIADMSLQSEMSVIRALNAEAGRQDKCHRVILMADLGDLREGFWDKDEMIAAACEIENSLPHIDLAGVGVNLGCYGSIAPTKEKLSELVDIAERIEARIGRELDYISGGATSSFMRVLDGDMPKRINMLRIGEAILLAYDLKEIYGYELTEMHQDTFRLKAEVIEVKDKPSYPVGKIAVDAFGHTPAYTDRGIRKRALLALGKVDYGDPAELLPREKGVEILGASSDHTIVDIEDAEKDYKVGDIMEFDVKYATVVYVTNSGDVSIVPI